MPLAPVFEMAAGVVALDSTVALDGADFRLEEGEFLAVLGANGSGKTTLVRALLGLAGLDSGSVRIFGSPLGGFREWARIGYVPQMAAAPPGAPASVMEVVLSGRVASARRFRPYSRSDRQAAARALEATGISDLAAHPIGGLSGGQHQRAMIARALAGEPDVLVLDEPTSGVDLDHQSALAAALGEMNRAGRTILLVAHTLGAIEDLVTREVVLQNGKVVYDGPHMAHHVHAEHVHHVLAVDEAGPLDRVARPSGD